MRLYVEERKMGVLQCLGYGEELMQQTFTSDPGRCVGTTPAEQPAAA